MGALDPAGWLMATSSLALPLAQAFQDTVILGLDPHGTLGNPSSSESGTSMDPRVKPEGDSVGDLSSKRSKRPGENRPAFFDRNDKGLGALDKQPACFETRSVERSSA